MTDFIGDFLSALNADGFEPKNEIVADDKWHPAYYNGEKGKCSGAYSMKIVDGDFAIGCYFSRKDPDNKIKWHSKAKESATPEEREARKAKIALEKRKRDALEAKRQQRISGLLSKYVKNLSKLDKHPYLKKKKIQPYPVKVRKKTGEIILPLVGSDGKVWTIQKINKKGGKYLFAGGKKQGCYYPIGSAKDDLSIILVCEGFATGVSLRQATKRPVIVAVDSGNLPLVTVALKSKYPDSKFIICADNDAFTKNSKGEAWNVGIEAAKKAPHAIGGAYIVHPRFDNMSDEDYNSKKPTDYNDLHDHLGLAAVTESIQEIINKIPVLQDAEAASVVESAPLSSQHSASGEAIEQKSKSARIKGDLGLNFKVLGYNDGTYYYFPFKERQIVALSASAHSNLANLLRLDTGFAWRYKFGDDPKISDRKIASMATEELIHTAQMRGYFKSEEHIRGAGAWMDKGRTVLHCGDSLYVDGVKSEFNEIESENTYIISSRLLSPSESPLRAEEAIKLRTICESVTWENPLSGSLLAGWIVIAPICGLLTFRPHLFINGEASSGKSTVMDGIIKPSLGKIALEADGGTTEPKLRQVMEYDARPIVYDEAENTQSFGAVIALARAATNGKTIGKFGQKVTKARYCFCFSAVNPPVEKAADETRMIFMTIKKNKKPTAIEDFNNLLAMIDSTLTEDFANRLLARTLKHIDQLQENIKTFKTATRRVLKDPRASELFGTIFAGLYLLSRGDTISVSEAEAWVAKEDWSSYVVDDEDTDPVRLLQYLSNCIIRVPHNQKIAEYSVGDLIIMASGIYKDEDADKHLRYHGIAVKDDRVYVAGRNQNLAKLLKGTDWSLKWTRMLANINGAKSFRMFYFSTGCRTSGVSIPLDLFKEEEPTPPVDYQSDLLGDEDEEIPF